MGKHLVVFCSLIFVSGWLILQAVYAQTAAVELVRSGQVVQSFTTIQAGIDASQPGDSVRVHGGRYFENLVISNKSGTASSPITLEGAAGETVMIDASYEPLTKPNNLWRSEPTFGTGVYSASVPFGAARTSDETYTYGMLADGTLLWTYSTAQYLRDFFSGPGIYPDRANKKLYVRLADGINPNNVPLYIAKSLALYIGYGTNSWRFRNLIFENGSYGVVFARGSGTAPLKDIQFSNVTVAGSKSGFVIWGPGENIVIKDSTLTSKWNFDWWWSDVKVNKPKTMEGSGIQLSSVTNAEVFGTNITGYFDGMHVDGANIKIHNNKIQNLTDDAIESEGNEINVEIYENYIANTLGGVALVPVQIGPVYIYRNFLVANGSFKFYKPGAGKDQPTATSTAFKLGAYDSGDSGVPSINTKVYHNTVYCKGACSSENTNTSKTARMTGWEWYNNIFYTGGTKIFNLDAVNYAGNIFKNNLWYPVVFGHDTSPVTGDPLFVNSTSLPLDLRIRSGSPAIDAGNSIPKSRNWPDSVVVNDSQPDVGVYEYSPSSQQTIKELLVGWLSAETDRTGDGKTNSFDFVLEALNLK